MNILSRFPYPWHEKAAQDLHQVLCDLIPSGKGAVFIAQRAGLHPAMLNECDPGFMVWRDVLSQAATAQATVKVVSVVLAQYPDNPNREFLQGLLEGGSSFMIAGPPRDQNGAAVFIHGASGDIKVPEALLFHDDLTLPIGRIEWMVGALRTLSERAGAICRIETTFAEGLQRGTGVRIGELTILTNWHVVNHEGAMAGNFVAEFGYDDNGQGGATASSAIKGAIASIKGDAEDDWAIVELENAPPPQTPIVALSNAAAPVMQAPAFIIQHPGGDRKRLAFVRNQITHIDDRVIHYLSDTQTGSSGAPVFDDEGRIIALHHAGGLPQEVAGKPPLRKNEGILIARIRAKLAALGIELP